MCVCVCVWEWKLKSAARAILPLAHPKSVVLDFQSEIKFPVTGPLMIFEMRTNHSHRDKYTPAKR